MRFAEEEIWDWELDFNGEILGNDDLDTLNLRERDGE